MRFKSGLCGLVLMLLMVGCRPGVTFYRPEQQKTIDRAVVDYPPDFQLKLVAVNLNAPTAISIDEDGTVFVVEGGIGNLPIHIFGRRIDGSIIEIYPRKTRVPFVPGGLRGGFKIYGPVGGIVAVNGKVYVTHRDSTDMGVITAFGYDGSHATVVAGFPARGDYGLTDIAYRRTDGRLYFGVGPATNSGIVGIDNWNRWLRKYPRVSDVPAVEIKLYGLKFRSPNPFAGWFGQDGKAYTAPFQAFNTNDATRIPAPPDGKANSTIYSIDPSGGDLKREAHGIRLPRGIGFNELQGTIFATNNGMELRGTRPIKDDPDALVGLKPALDTWVGFPDYSSEMLPISDKKYEPPASMLQRSGYPGIDQVIDIQSSNPPMRLYPPNADTLLQARFPWLSGASKFDFIPASTTLSNYRKQKLHGRAVVALSGDRAPFATSGQPITGPGGYKVVSVDLLEKQVHDFIYNTRGLPASKLGKDVVALERPCDVKLHPDGSIYVLDMGPMENRDGVERVKPAMGRLFRLEPVIEPEPPAGR